MCIVARELQQVYTGSGSVEGECQLFAGSNLANGTGSDTGALQVIQLQGYLTVVITELSARLGSMPLS